MSGTSGNIPTSAANIPELNRQGGLKLSIPSHTVRESDIRDGSSTHFDDHPPLIYTRRYGPGHKERLRLLLDEPSSSALAFWISIFIALTIVSSSVAAIIETVPAYYKSQRYLWSFFEGTIVVAFTLEFFIRCYVHSSNMRQFSKFCRSFYTWIDLIAIIPYYAGLLVVSDGWTDMQRFTVLRLFRLLRLFRCYTFSSLLQLSIDALIMSLKKSVDALLALLVFISFIMVAFSTLLYFAERGTWDPVRRTFLDINGNLSQFSSIPASFWFVSEAITTVGLGDVYPKTTMGKAITVPLMMFSLLIIALPSIVIGRNFSESWAWLRSTRPTRTRPATALLSNGCNSTNAGPNTNHGGNNAMNAMMAPIPFTSTSHGSQASPLLLSNDPDGREAQFLAELSSTQLPMHLSNTADHHDQLPATSNDIAEHGDVMLGILQELQRQNGLLERLVMANANNNQYGSSISRAGSFSSQGQFKGENDGTILEDV